MRRLVLYGSLVLTAAALLGPSAVTAESPERAFGRVIVTIQGEPREGDAIMSGPELPVRYEVDAVLTTEASRYRSGVVIRFELPNVTGDHQGIAALDIDIDALLAARVLAIGVSGASFGYREVGPAGAILFDGHGVDGAVALLSLGPRDQALALHVAFGARVVDTVTGEARLFTDGEAASLPEQATHPETVVVWRDDTPPDMVFLDALYVTTDCTGDPLYDPIDEIEPGASATAVYEDQPVTDWDDGAYVPGGTDYGYGDDHVGVDPGDGTGDGGDSGWDGWDPGDDWGGDGVNDGGGWTPGDGTNDGGGGDVDPPDWSDDGGGGDDGGWDDDWDDGGWDDGGDDGSAGYDSYDPGGGCGGEDDPGYEDDSLDCSGDDPGGGGGGGVDTSCSGSDTSDGSSSDPLDCDTDATAAPTFTGADTAHTKRPRRWRGWNLSPLFALFGWWAFLRSRRGRPLPREVVSSES